MDENSTMRLGPGTAMALAPDGKSALVQQTRDRSRLRLLPFDERKPMDLEPAGIDYQWVRFFPDGHRLLALANEPGHPLRLYVQPAFAERSAAAGPTAGASGAGAPQGAKPYPITPPVVARNVAISLDGTKVAVFSANTGLTIYSTEPGGSSWRVPTTGSWAPLLWRDPDWLYVQQIGAYTEIPTRLARLHLPDGRIEPWKDISPVDALGVNAITKVMLSGDAHTVVFNYRRVLSELFVAIPAS
jgi:hypothetical protein